VKSFNGIIVRRSTSFRKAIARAAHWMYSDLLREANSGRSQNVDLPRCCCVKTALQLDAGLVGRELPPEIP
jgi:hypothetical protein